MQEASLHSKKEQLHCKIARTKDCSVLHVILFIPLQTREAVEWVKLIIHCTTRSTSEEVDGSYTWCRDRIHGVSSELYAAQHMPEHIGPLNLNVYVVHVELQHFTLCVCLLVLPWFSLPCVWLCAVYRCASVNYRASIQQVKLREHTMSTTLRGVYDRLHFKLMSVSYRCVARSTPHDTLRD
jgi:hypothetical protein